jgi:hypothetical protein
LLSGGLAREIYCTPDGNPIESGRTLNVLLP